MARLNESTAPIESIDILKRRFVRQNREIARVNSIQSLRIRSLESEVSHLLSENVSLREQVITLNQEIERFEAAKMLQNGVHNLKTKLEKKLLELNDLVADLGSLPRKYGKLSDEKAGSTGHENSRSSNLDLRRRVTAYDGNPVPDDGKLPVILEDKCYPRRTLEPQEVEGLFNDSPDGAESSVIDDEVSIPQLSFEDSDLSSKFAQDPTQMRPIVADSDDDLTFLPPTLETRKKKRPSLAAMDGKVFDVDYEISNTQHDPRYIFKSGSKRKFVSDDDDQISPMATRDDDDFQFSRPNQVTVDSDDQSVPAREDISPVSRQVEVTRGSKNKALSKRKVLEPKSTNLNMASPKKFRASAHQSEDHKANPILQAEGDVNRSSYPTTQKEKAKKKKHIDLSNETKCPFVSRIETNNDAVDIVLERNKQDIISPGVSASQSPDDSKTTSEMANAPSRPSRRQRAVVSYAEPNLRDKMRRPTKELIDAVGRNGNRRSSSSEAVRADEEGCKTGSINKESSRALGATDGDSTSPSTDSWVDPSKQSMNMVSQRKRKTLPGNKDDSPIKHAQAEVTLEADSSPHEQNGAGGCGSGLANAMSDLDHGINGRERVLQSTVTQDPPKKPNKTALRQSRRHSSNPRSCVREAFIENSDDPAITHHTLAKGDFETLNTSLATSYGSTLLGDSRVPEEDGEDSQYSMAADTKHTRRGQRVAARRRSMML